MDQLTRLAVAAYAGCFAAVALRTWQVFPALHEALCQEAPACRRIPRLTYWAARLGLSLAFGLAGPAILTCRLLRAAAGLLSDNDGEN